MLFRRKTKDIENIQKSIELASSYGEILEDFIKLSVLLERLSSRLVDIDRPMRKQSDHGLPYNLGFSVLCSAVFACSNMVRSTRKIRNNVRRTLDSLNQELVSK